MKNILTGWCCIVLLWSCACHAQRVNPYPAAIEQVQHSIVGVGVLTPTSQPPYRLAGTGFAVGDGLWIVTNAHLVPSALDTDKREQMAVFLFRRDPNDSILRVQMRGAQVKRLDRERDLALLRIEGEPLPALKLSVMSELLPVGSELAFTGYALGQGYGVSLTTHRGMISAVTFAVLSIPHAQQLNAGAIRTLRDKPSTIYQLDATGFPGHSGSPIYDPQKREIVAIVSGGMVKGNREMAISNPSGITYAVPVQYVLELLRQAMEKP